jgi:hypothetical protein
MSISSFSKIVKNAITRSLQLTRDKGKYSVRKKLDKKFHVMEISRATLLDGFSVAQTTITENKVDKIYGKVKNIVTKTPKFSNKKEALRRGSGTIFHHVSADGNSVLLISTNFSSLSRYLKNNVKQAGIKELEKIDIGHTVGFGKEEHNAVASARIYQAGKAAIAAAKRKGIDTAPIQNLVDHYIEEYNQEHLKYRVESTKVGSAAKELVGKIDFIYTTPQSPEINETLLGEVEKKLKDQFTADVMFLYDSSASLKKRMNKQIRDAFFGNPIDSFKDHTPVKGTVKLNKPIKKKKVVSNPIPRLRNAKGQFTSTIKLKELLEPLVKKRVKQDMDSAQYFKTLTGRFTSSVQIEDVMQSSRGLLIKYNYKQRPYRVFEKGGSHYKDGREPSQVIEKSIRQAAAALVSKKFKVIPQLGAYE